MVKIVEVTELKEVAFVPALFWALAAAGMSLTAYDAYQAYSDWHDGEISDDDLKVRLGVQAAETILNFAAIGGAVQGAKLGWRAFRRAWRQASRQEPQRQTPPLTRDNTPVDRSFDRDQPMSNFGDTGARNPRYNPLTGRTDPPLRSGDR